MVFFAVGMSGTMLFFLDNGVTWIDGSSGSGDFYGLAFYGSDMIIVGDGVLILKEDGNCPPTPETSGTNGLLFDVIATSNGTLVTVGGDTTTGDFIILTSRNNGTWTNRTSPTPSFNIYGLIVTSNGTIFEVGTYDSTLVSSDNGQTWDTRIYDPNALLGYLEEITVASNGNLVLVGTSRRILTSSDNSVTWIPQYSGASNYISKVAETRSGTLVAVGDNVINLTSTDNGVTWSSSDLFGINYYAVVAY